MPGTSCVLNRKVFRSSTFRLALIYITFFAVSTLLLLAFIYWSTAGYMTRQTDAAIEADIDVLADRYRLHGLVGLTNLIAERIAEDPAHASIYLLTASDFKPVVGNIDRWPEGSEDKEGWLNFSLKGALSGGDTHWARARSFRLRGGFLLLVGRDMYELEAMRRLIIETLSWGLLITLVLAAIGGATMSRSMVHRIETINQASREIMEGDLARRIPERGTGDDFDELVGNLNTMLDRIQELMESVRRVSDNIAHDLRTPLTRLRSSLELFRSAEHHGEDAGALLEQAVAEADALMTTFNALLRIARVETGEIRAGFAPLQLGQLLRDVAEFYEPLCEEKEQRFSITVAGEATINGDRDLLFQAVANLLDNAIKYTPKGGSIHMDLATAAQTAGLSIADSGPGIPAHEREKVLQRFYRLESSRNTPGNGLGLSLVAAVAHLHDAHLRLEDNSPNGLRVVLEFNTT